MILVRQTRVLSNELHLLGTSYITLKHFEQTASPINNFATFNVHSGNIRDQRYQLHIVLIVRCEVTRIKMRLHVNIVRS